MKVRFLVALTVVFWLSFTSLAAQEAILTPILSSTPNFRDLAGISASNGGTGFVNTTGRGGMMRTGVMYRSDYLSLSNADWITMSALRIGRDIDLRTPEEIQANPDLVPYGATYTRINIYGVDAPVPMPFAAAPAAAAAFMQAGYQAFVTDPVQRNRLRTVLVTLANDRFADLYHCSGGKDRTGWTSMLLQSIAGISQATITRDYLATNTYTAAVMGALKADLLSAHPGWDPATIDALLGVQSGYLEAGLDQVIASYGSMHGYLTQGLGLTQADIYVLRARMVYYPVLPGQRGLEGNAAAGAAFLNALQNSPLSGAYTNFNYYLQSAIDAGTLGGVETRVGGQVHADAASFLLRRPLWIDELIAPYASGRDLRESQTSFWAAAPGGGFWSTGGAGTVGSTETSAGSILGVTRRFTGWTSINVAIGYNWGSVESSGGSATLNTVLGTIGGRYAFSSLEAGPYVLARADFGWVDYESRRDLGGALGNAKGRTNGVLYGGLAGMGNIIRLAPFTFALQTGVRITGTNVKGFDENDSELALNVDRIDEMYSSVLFDLNIGIDRRQAGAWSITPLFTLGYERILSNPKATSTGSLYGLSLSQDSAFDSQDLIKAGLGVTVERGAVIIKTGINGIAGSGSGSTGISGQLSVSYKF